MPDRQGHTPPGPGSSEDLLLQQTVRRWVAERADPEGAAFARANEPAPLAGLVAEAGALGLDEALAGGDPALALTAAQELGRCRWGGLVALLLSAAAARAGGGPAGSVLVAGAPVDGERPLTTVGTEACVQVHGSCGWVVGARRAAAFVVLAGPAQARRVLVVPRGDGVTIAALPESLGRDGSAAGVVRFDRVPARPGVAAAQAVLARCWLLEGGALVGAAARAWEDAAAYGRQRHAFGRPLASFQVNRHALARALTEITAARQALQEVAHASISGQPEAPVAAARVLAERVARAVLDRCLQLHGGSGYAEASAVQRTWRDVRTPVVDTRADLYARLLAEVPA